MDTCLFERFGDEIYDNAKSLPGSLWNAYSASMVQVPETTVCDLTKPETLSALRVDLSALMNDNLDLPKAWGLAIQRHSRNFQGLKYKSRFNDRTCLVLFQRDSIQSTLAETSLGPLSALDEAVDWLDKHRVNLY